MHEAYLSYNIALRTWMIGAAVSAFALFLKNDFLAAVSKSPCLARWGFVFIMFAATFQLATALLNKWSNWFRYDRSLRHPGDKDRPLATFNGDLARLSDAWRRWFILQFVGDVISVLAMVFGAACVFGAYISDPLSAGP